MRILLIIFILIVVIFMSSCPTPFGILYGDKIIHWDGEVENIKDWIDGDDETTDVTITVKWPWDN